MRILLVNPRGRVDRTIEEVIGRADSYVLANDLDLAPDEIRMRLLLDQPAPSVDTGRPMLARILAALSFTAVIEGYVWGAWYAYHYLQAHVSPQELAYARTHDTGMSLLDWVVLIVMMIGLLGFAAAVGRIGWKIGAWLTKLWIRIRHGGHAEQRKRAPRRDQSAPQRALMLVEDDQPNGMPESEDGDLVPLRRSARPRKP